MIDWLAEGWSISYFLSVYGIYNPPVTVRNKAEVIIGIKFCVWRGSEEKDEECGRSRPQAFMMVNDLDL